MDFRLRAMEASDLDAVVAIASALPEAPRWARLAYVEAIASQDGPRRIALVAENDDGAAGFLVASLVGSEAELESIAVARFAQRRGAATALLAALIEDLKGVGATDLALEVRASNHAARDFYERAGFLEAGVRRGYYRDPQEDALILKLRI